MGELIVGIFSILWQILFLFISLLNIFNIFKYYIDKQLMKNNVKISIPGITGIAVGATSIFILVEYYFREGDNPFVFSPTSAIIDNSSLFIVFFASATLLVLIDIWVNLDCSKLYKDLNIFCTILLLALLPFLILNFISYLSKDVLGNLLFLPIDLKLFYIYKIYRYIILPCVYYLLFFQFFLTSKKKCLGAGDYDKKIKKIYKLKKILLFFYFIFVSGVIWFDLINFNVYYEDWALFLPSVATNTFFFILIYAVISSYVSNIKDKPNIFGNLIKKAFSLLILFPYIILILIIGWDKLQAGEIKIIPIVITAILIAIVTAIIDILIHRFYKI